jgi:hypothetical protein
MKRPERNGSCVPVVEFCIDREADPFDRRLIGRGRPPEKLKGGIERISKRRFVLLVNRLYHLRLRVI